MGDGVTGVSGDMMDLPVPKKRGYRLRRVLAGDVPAGWQKGIHVAIIFGLRVFYRTIAQAPFTAAVAAETGSTGTGQDAGGSRCSFSRSFR